MERVNYESVIIQDLLNFYNDGSLDISPWYQRRSVWSNPQKSYLVNTIHENKPIPSIYIRHTIDIEKEKSIKQVVDGQQRIRTIIGYKNDEFSTRHPNYDRKVFYSDLTRNDKTAFLSTSLSIGYLIGADDQDVIEIFGRINSISKTLNPQEKRNSQYSGEFKQLCLREAATRLPFWRSTGLFTATQISRMQEVQFISDLVVNMIEGLTDFSSKKIDDYYKKYDEDFEMISDIEQRIENLFSKLVDIPPGTVRDTIFSVPQIMFSLMIIVDTERARRFSPDQILEVMHQIDNLVGGYQEKDALSEVQKDDLLGFTGGNLHRIKARRIRDRMICEALL